MKAKCCIYCRIDDSRNESSLTAIMSQRDLLRGIASELNLDVACEYLLFESGTNPGRQSVKTLIRDAKHGCYQYLLVKSVTRLSRSTEGFAMIGEKLYRYGIKVYTPDGPVRIRPQHAYFYSRYGEEVQ